MNTPVVSVIMPIYNAAAYMRAAVGSILQQTMRDLELIAVDDGSSDDSLSIALELAASDPRMHVESLPRNEGTASARNAAIARARGRYLAFLDADDVALPSRLATQLSAIQHHPGPALSCSATMLMDPAGTPSRPSIFRRSEDQIAPTLLFSNVIVASTVLVSREGFPGFRRGYEPAEDYDAWLRSIAGLSIHYQAEPLVRYRVHETAVSSRQGEQMKLVRERIVAESLARLGVEATADDVTFHLSIADGTFAPTAASLERAERWLLQLRDANLHTKLFASKPFAHTLGYFWSSVCNGCWQVPSLAIHRLAASPLAPPWRDRWPLSARLRLRALLAR